MSALPLPQTAPGQPATAAAALRPPLPRPAIRPDELGPLGRQALVGTAVLAHLAGAWGLMQLDSVRQVVAEAAPLMVQWIAPPADRPAPPPPPPPKPRVTPPAPAPVIAAAPAPAREATPAFVAPEPSPVPAAVTAPATPPAPPAPPAAPAAPAVPKLIPASALRYTHLPQQVYPLTSRRLGEQGTVLVKVVVDVQGRPRLVALHQSSGHARLDEQALTAMRAARFSPYLDNGVAVEAMAIAPLAYELD